MRRAVLLVTLAVAATTVSAALPSQAVFPTKSPNGGLILTVSAPDGGQLEWSVGTKEALVIERSTLDLVLDGIHLGVGVRPQRPQYSSVSETFPWRGIKSEIKYRANTMRLRLLHQASKIEYWVETRVSNDAAAIRFVVPGTGRRVPDAAIRFQIPAGSTVWSHGLRDHYEALYEKRQIESLPDGDWAAPPVTIKLPTGIGYAAIMESNLRNYAGMALQADGKLGLLERLGHSHPPGYPYTLRYGEENAKRLAVAAPIDGTITTPWRVVSFGRDLNALVNSDAVHALADPHDPALFPRGARTPWLKHGRAVWRYLDGGENTPAGIKEFSTLAAQLGFEHQVVEGQWARWSEDDLKDVIAYSKSQGVSLWLWRHSNTLMDPAKRRDLFARVRALGAVGLKVDFLDHEAKEVIDLYQAILRDAAEHQLMINFHGANKPAGESRTWPNELTREGIYGLEHRRVERWATFNAEFPFVRMLTGHADYTPVVFGERRKETSWAHQVASAAILTSPLLVYGGHPSSFLDSPAVDMIKSIPSVWDETRVLPPSEIGELALFARRSGNTWFVAAMNGPAERTIKVDLSFLPRRTYRALIVRDRGDDPAALIVETRDVSRSLEIAMRGGGGFIARLE